MHLKAGWEGTDAQERGGAERDPARNWRIHRMPMSTSASVVSGLTTTGSVVTDDNDTHVLMGMDGLVAGGAASIDASMRRGDEALYRLIDKDFSTSIPNPDLRRVVQLCLAAFCVVFQETNVPKEVGRAIRSDLPSVASGNGDDGPRYSGHLGPFVYTRMPGVPAGAARMLWRALIGSLIHPDAMDSDEDEDAVDGITGLKLAEFDDACPGGIRRDPSLDESTVRGFFDALQLWIAGEDVHYPKEDPHPSGLGLGLGKFFGFGAAPERPASQTPGERHCGNIASGLSVVSLSTSRVSLPSHITRNKHSDTLYKFVRDMLVQMGVMEVVGKRNDDVMDYCYDDHHAFSNEEEGGKRDTSRKRKRRTQYLQIQRDVQHQYGVFLSGVPVSEDGFATYVDDSPCDDLDGSETIAAIIRECATMKTWNGLLADECMKKRYRQKRDKSSEENASGSDLLVDFGKRGTIENGDGDDSEATEAHGLRRRRIMKDKSPPHEAWLFKGTSKWPLDDGTRYAVHMLPAHLMRANRITETAELLCSPNFFGCRCSMIGAQKASVVQRQDLEELELRIGMVLEDYSEVNADGSEIDTKATILMVCDVMVRYLTKKYASIKASPASKQQVSVGEDTGEPRRHEKVRGEKTNGETGRALHGIAWFLGKKGFSNEASSCYKKALKFKSLSMGNSHQSVAATLQNMGNLSSGRNEFKDAIRYYREALRIERRNSHNKQIIASTLNSLGMNYGMSFEYEKAIECYEEALEVESEQNGPENLRSAEVLNNIGIIHGIRGDYVEAVRMYSEALRIKRSQLGEMHPEVGDNLYSLGIVHTKREDFSAAVDCYQSSLLIRKKTLGEDHEEVARVLHCLGIVLSDMGEIDNSIRCYEESLRIRLLRLGDDHEDVARTLNNLGLTYFKSEDYNRALECFKGTLRVSKKGVNSDHAKIADTMNSIGQVYAKLRKLEQARKSFLGALRVMKERFDDDHVSTGSTLHNLADVFYMMDLLDDAVNTYQEAYRIRLVKLGPDDIDVAATRNNMGVAHLKNGNNELAIECFIEALRVRELRLGLDDDQVGDTLHNLGLVHKNMKQYEDAILRYTAALRLRKEKSDGNGCIKVADTIYNMAIVYANSNRFEIAVEYYKEALETYRDVGLSKDHPSVVNTLQWIKWAEKKQAKSQQEP